MSPPAEKARFPAAVITTRVIAGSLAQSPSCARKASTMACVTALSACGRLSVTMPAAPLEENVIRHCGRPIFHLLPRRPGARIFQAFHRLVGEFGARSVAADHEHQDRFRVRIALGDVLEAADHARRE